MTETVLADEVNAASSSVLRFAYATAFSRFVTGLVDTDQKARYRVSMYEKAKQLGLPAAFVELRHEITHEELPNLSSLRHVVKRSLQWLWDDYWAKLTPALPSTEPKARSRLKERFRSILRRYVDKAYQLGPGSKDLAHAANDCSCELVEVSPNHELVDDLVVVMLERGMMNPGDRQ